MRRLSPVEWGHYAIAQSAGSILTVLVTCGMMLAASPQISRQPSDVGAIVCAALLVRTIAWLGCIVAIGIVSLHYDGSLAWALISVTGLLLVQVINLDFALVGLGRTKSLAKAGLVSAIASIGIIYTMISPHTYAWQVPMLMALGLLAGYLVQLRDLGVVLFTKPSEIIAKSLELARKALPSTIAAVAVIFTYNVDTLFLGIWRVSNVERIGEYASLSKLTQLATMPMVAILFSGAPQLTRASAEKNWSSFRKTERMLRLSFATVGAVGGLAIAIFGPLVIEFLTKRPVSIEPHVAACFGLAYFLIGLHSAWTSTLPFLNDHLGYMLVNLGAAATMVTCLTFSLKAWGFTGAVLSLVVSLISAYALGVYRYRKISLI